MRLILALLIVLHPCVALSQPTSAPTSSSTSPPVLLELPKGTPVKTPQGVLRGFSLREFKIVLKIEADYRSWGVQIPKFRILLSNSSLVVENQVKQMKLLVNQVQILQDDRKRLTLKWAEENRLRHLAENKPEFGSWFAWGSSAVLAATAAVLAGILLAKD